MYVITAASAPAAFGSNSIEFVQLAPAGSGFVHVEADLVNELAPLPVIVVVAVKLTAGVLELLIVMTGAAVVVPTAVEAKVSDIGLNVRPGAAPVPDNATVCGVPDAESVYVTVAVSVPAEAGVNVMVFVQLAPAASGLLQVEADLVNELAPEPVMVVDAVKLTAAEVAFFNVITCVAALFPTVVEANVSEDGVIVSPVLALAPVPDNATVCFVVEAESVYVTIAVNVPAEAGWNVMVLVQLAPAASGLGQVVADFVNELAFVPVMVVAAVNETEAEVLFFNVITCVAAAVPTVVEGNVSEAGVIVKPELALTPVPDSATVCGDPVAVSVYVTTAESAPATVGSNSIEFVQLAPAASGFEQVEADLINELAPLPVIVVDAVKVTAAELVFLIVIVCAAVVVPIAVEAKLSEDGVNVSAAPAALTVTTLAALTDVTKLLSPPYTAVIESFPTGSDVIFSVADPEASDSVPMFAPLFWNTTFSAFVLRSPEL